jgi:Zn-dependent protease
MSNFNIGQFITMIVPLVFAVTIHEAAHGYAALRMGDRTAQLAGRLTLNPIRHFDLFGSLILPLLLSISGAPVFGYAKPVPVNPFYYRDFRIGTLLVSSAGVAANLACAILSGIAFQLLRHISIPVAFIPLMEMLLYSVIINLVLMVFNLIPIPPLDGSHILAMILPENLRASYQQIGRFGMIIIFVLLSTKVIGKIIHSVVNPLGNLLLGR